MRGESPYLDGFDQPIIPEYAQRHAQFMAGKVWSSGGVNQQDLIDTYEELPWLNVFAGGWTRSVWQIYFGLRPDSPFRDERVRRAVSALIDRDLVTETFYGLGDLKEARWPVELRTHSIGVAGRGTRRSGSTPGGTSTRRTRRRPSAPTPTRRRS